MNVRHGRVVSWLSSELREALLLRMASMQWRDGRETASGVAAEVKRCEVANFDAAGMGYTQEGAELVSSVWRAICRAPGFIAAALPGRLGAVRLMRYGVGGHYGLHTDEALSATGFRADLAFTVLLKAAEEGGELHVSGRHVEMLEGDVFLYPSTTAHGVTRVQAGERIVLVGWVESMVRDHSKRALLAQLQAMVENPNERQTVNIQSVRNELLRRWGG